MAQITIIGAGTMGQALAAVVGKGGNTVQQLTSGDADQPVTGDVVILAVPHAAVAQIVAERGEQLAGRVVVDITNPISFETFELTVPAEASAAAEIALALPQAKVLKAFNTNFGATLASGTVGEVPTTVLIAGDDDDAKAQLADIVTAGGLRALDVGPLRRARELEALAFLQITLAATGKLPWTGGFAVVS